MQELIRRIATAIKWIKGQAVNIFTGGGPGPPPGGR